MNPFEILVSTVGRMGSNLPDEPDVQRMSGLAVDGIMVRPWSDGDGTGLTLSAMKKDLDRFARQYL